MPLHQRMLTAHLKSHLLQLLHTPARTANSKAEKERDKPAMEVSGQEDVAAHCSTRGTGENTSTRVQDGLVFANITRQATERERQEEHLLVTLPQTLIEPVLYAGHEAARHFGTSKTKALVLQHFYWPGMIKEYRRTCPVCLQSRSPNLTASRFHPLEQDNIGHC